MARKRRSYLFEDFDFAEGAFNLFQNSIRSAMDYDANISDQFEATVLTNPTRVSGDVKNRIKPITDKTETFAFMVRILGPQSPHKFLPEPCELYKTEDPESRRVAFNVIQQHTKVFMEGSTTISMPTVGDTVKIILDRGEFGSYKTDVAKQYISISAKARVPASGDAACVALAKAFTTGDVNMVPMGSYSTPTVATYVPGDGGMPIPEVENGRLEDYGITFATPDPSLYISTAGEVKLMPEAIKSFENVMRDYMEDHPGKKISISSHYRTYERQVRMKEEKGKYAATPGKSNHGWAIAFDVNGTREMADGTTLKTDAPDTHRRRFDSPLYKWLDNGGRGRHGWINPPSLRRESGGVIEAWQWENVTIRDTIFIGTPPTPEGATTEIEETPEE